MVLPPRHVYSATVKNMAPNPVKVKATYAMPNGMAEQEEEFCIHPGATTKIEQKVVQVDTVTLTGHICRVAVDGAVLEAPFNGVFSPVKDYKLEIHYEENTLKLHGKP